MHSLNEFEQTGLQGVPTEPFVVSFAAVGPADCQSGPDLVSGFRSALSLIEQFKLGLVDKWPQVVGWVLQRSSLKGVDRTWEWEDGSIDLRRLGEALDGFPEKFESVWLSNMAWGGLKLSLNDLGDVDDCRRGNRALAADLRAPEGHVERMAYSMLGLLEEQARVEGVTTGFVHVDSIADPYGQVVSGLAGLSVEDFAVEVHGYYWAVLLTGGHLRRLGGIESVRREAPCEIVKDLDTSDGVAALCVLTESPSDMNAERVVAWQQFLSPVLRAGYPGWLHDVGVRRAPLQRPVWLFEGAPVPGATKHLLSYGLEPRNAPPMLEVGSVRDPESLVCLLYPGECFDRDHHTGSVAAIVRAWCAAGRSARLHGLDGSLSSCSDLDWDTDDAGKDVLVWQFDCDDCDGLRAVNPLLAALSQLEDLAPAGRACRVLNSLRLE